MSEKDNIVVNEGEKWAFNEEVATVFEDMLRRSVPGYDEMRELCFKLGCRMIQPWTTIMDLGCSRGEAMANFVERYKEKNTYVGVEISKSMRDVCEGRFKEYIEKGIVFLSDADLRHEYPSKGLSSSLTMCVLTLMFIPVEYRQKLLSRIYSNTVNHGGLILVEKVIGGNPVIDGLISSEYYDLKRLQGYSEEQITRKRLSLEGVLVPLTAQWNEDTLRMVGFRYVECFWRNLNFMAWLAIKVE